ncbi:hypothetical protein AZE42_04236 [Rhizopogon vesiculosus]|uniref:Uncharacterized protein n=1 Tax=Rhizopogon vesiculosus TaxID=180088 RepID=A0A1J8PYJ6_9AGAM|nr:hypothetical protein AZE42_04236 [Rhizopogon vesiculosus]
MVQDISIEAAIILAIIIESILYGISTFLFGITLWSLTYQRNSAEVSRLMIAATCLLFLLGTMPAVIESGCCFRAKNGKMVDLILRDGNIYKFTHHQLRSFQLLPPRIKFIDHSYLGILAFKLWSVHQRTSRICATRSPVYHILVIIMKCRALYSMSLLTMLVIYLTASNSTFIVVDMVRTQQNEQRNPPP